MKGDFSRLTFNPKKHHSGVLFQQGRVQLDADLNELQAIRQYLDAVKTRDVIGWSGAPQHGDGFRIYVSKDGSDLTISSGRIYVDGHLCIAEERPGGYSYFHQPCFVPERYPEIPEKGERARKRYLVYLDVWERFITAIDDPEIREKALGGVDTAGRTKTVWQVKLLAVEKDADCSDFGPDWTPMPQPGGQLNVRTAPVAKVTNNCLLPSQAGYRGLENQLYRVEIHKGGDLSNGDKVTFKWSRDNGSVVAAVKEIDGSTIIVENIGTDEVNGFATGQWAELLDDFTEFHRIPGLLSRITVDDTNRITLADSPEQIKPADLKKRHVKLRRWDCSGEQQVEIPKKNDGWISLENEIEIKFSKGYYTTGDYWIIPARSGIQSETGSIEWPYGSKINPIPQPPRGVRHHYAPLAIVVRNSEGFFEQSRLPDCRNLFLPLIDLKAGKMGQTAYCCTMTVGDGVTSHGDFNNLQQAINNMPEQGGEICMLPGIHHANAVVTERADIHIKGCGSQSILHPNEKDPTKPILSFSSCHDITIEGLTLITFDGTAVEVDDGDGISTTGLLIEKNHIFALTHAIDIRVRSLMADKNDIRIRDNDIGIWDLEGGDVAIFSNANNVVIEENRILVISRERQKEPQQPGDLDFSFLSSSEDRLAVYRQRPAMLQAAKATIAYVKTLKLLKAPVALAYKAKGGIQLGGGSEMVRISDNRIIGGSGNGITLGHLPVRGAPGSSLHKRIIISSLDPEILEYLLHNFSGFLYGITIEKNDILGMGLSGISVVAFMHSKRIGLTVDINKITIRENHITRCTNRVPDEKPEAMLQEAGFGGIVLTSGEDVVITGNRIEHNGRYQNQAICGVLILYGENIDISDNHISNNGRRTPTGGQAPGLGLRGGIVVLRSLKQPDEQFEPGEGPDHIRPDGIPAVKVHDNIVVQPMGKALFLNAFGPVSVVNNQFTSQRTDYRTDPLSVVAGAVLIINLGVSRDLMAAMFLESFRDVARTDLKKRTEALARELDIADIAETLAFLPSGNVIYSGNQMILCHEDEMISPAFSALTIASFDDIACNGNQSEVRSLYDYLVSDMVLIGTTVRANNNRLQEALETTLNSLIVAGFMAMATANQATRCLQLFGWPEFLTLLGNNILYQQSCADLKNTLSKYFDVPDKD